MAKNFAIKFTLDNVLACNLQGKGERDIRELIYLFWNQAERMQQIVINLDYTTYDNIVSKVMKKA